MIGIGSGQFSEDNVAAVAVPSVLAPAPENPLGSGCLTDIELAGLRVGDQVDALHGAEGCLPSS
jgi:hypothetical protein